MTKEELGRIQARGAEILKYLEVVIDRANRVNDLNVAMMRNVDPNFIASVWVGELVLANLEKDGLKTDKKFPDIKKGNLSLGFVSRFISRALEIVNDEISIGFCRPETKIEKALLELAKLETQNYLTDDVADELSLREL